MNSRVYLQIRTVEWLFEGL